MGIAERKDRERRQRRQQIVDAARKVFSAKGFKGATMEDIAREAELSPATLYLYFRNKDELYAAINLDILEHVIEKMEGVQKRDDLTPNQKVDGFKEAFYSLYQFDPLMLKYVFHLQASEDLRNLSPEILSEIKRLSQRSIRAMAGIFEDGVRQGIFVDALPIALADVFWAVFTGLVIWEDSKKALDSRKDYLKPTLDLAVDILNRGISKDPGAAK